MVISTARNQVESKQDPTAHAEIECIRAAAAVTKNWRLNGCTLYTTLEPCAMCMAAIQQARIEKLVFGACDARLGAAGSWVDMVHGNKHPFHQVIVESGVLNSESSSLLKKFFLLRRREMKSNSESGLESNSKLIDRGFDYRSLTEND